VHIHYRVLLKAPDKLFCIIDLNGLTEFDKGAFA
jgi:hypothetical protein